MADDVVWFTFEGFILPLQYEVWPDKKEVVRAFEQRTCKTSFVKQSVICFDGDNDLTYVCVNHRHPIWHILNLSVDDFRKEFFS